MDERWRAVTGYEGRYEVSDHGRVRSLLKGIVLKEETHWKGHKKVDLCSEGKCTKYFVHRLVAIAFIPQIVLERDVVNHRDEDKTNNHVLNLEWVTLAENTKLYFGIIEDIDF